MILKTGAAGLEIIKRNEGCKLTAYQDVVGVWTIGFGDTGPDVKPGLVITLEEAERRLAGRLAREFEVGVRAAIDGAPTTQGQFDAMVSLAYNIGVGAFDGSTVARKHGARDYGGAADAFLMWNKAGGRALTGLTRRREEERKLYLSDVRQAALTPIAAPETAMRAAVRSVQHLLNGAGILTKRDGSRPGLVDGDPGEMTCKALAEWRSAHPV